MSLERKIGKRKGLRIIFKDALGQVDAILNDESASHQILFSVKNRLTTIIEQLNSIDDDICDLLDPDDVEDDVIECSKILQPTHLMLVQLNEKIEGFKAKSVSASENTVSSSNGSQHRLPKLEIPTFKGDPLQWQGFWDQFSTSVHDHDRLSDIDRFNYLKGRLVGQALDAISGLSLSSANYKEAVQILKDRFGNPQVLISSHMDHLIKMKKVSSSEDFDGLRKLLDNVENCIRNLNSLDLDTNSYGSLLIPLLKDKMPDDLVMIVSRRFGSAVWTIDRFITYFNDELKALENARPSANDSKSVNRLRKPEYTASNLLTQNSNKDTPGRLCVFCKKGGHGASQCRLVTNIRSRRDMVFTERRCYVCLEVGHKVKDCKSNYMCRKCNGKHHVSLCTSRGGVKKDNPSSESHSGHIGVGLTNRSMLLQTAKAAISDARGKAEMKCRVIFDSGSQRTYVNEDVCRKLSLEVVREERVIIKAFGQEGKVGPQTLRVVKLRVRHRYRKEYICIEAICVPSVCSPLTQQNISYAHQCFVQLTDLDLADENDGRPSPVDILIGVDFYHAFFNDEIIRIRGGPVASKSVLGWVLSGPLPVENFVNSQHCFHTHVLRSLVEDDNSLRDDLKKFWGIENVESAENSVVHRFEKEIYHDGERYVTKLPFKPRFEILPDNFDVCVNRLTLVTKRLKSQNMIGEYDKIFNDYESQGIIERVPECEIAKELGTVHYLPHRPVVRIDKETTKIRAVFDASCSVNGSSLNESLYPGPNLLAKIFDILLRFRLNKIAIIADIKQAFLNVGISREHQDFLRFLWQDIKNESIVVYRFQRAVFGVNSSPFLLNATIRRHLNKYLHKCFVERLLQDMYVDDTTSGCSTVAEGIEFYNTAIALMLEAGFTLCKWTSNDATLQAHFNERENSEPANCRSSDDVSFCEEQLGLSDLHKRVLGIEWDTSSDEFVFRFDDLIEKGKSESLTKRNVLSLSSSIFDPLGLVSPITARVKTIFQLLCKDSLAWDQKVPVDILKVWKDFIKALELMGELRIKRLAFQLETTEKLEKIEIHGFADSSKNVYCAVVYLRVVTSADVKVFLLSSKTKVAPLKALTIPRLELLACVLLSKLVGEIKKAIGDRLKIDSIFCWTDSEVALCWLKGEEKVWKTWVENRVVKIRCVVPRENWNHVAGKENPADIPTRMVRGSFRSFFNELWIRGPAFLSCCDFHCNNFSLTDKLRLVDVISESRKTTSNVDLKDYLKTSDIYIGHVLTEHNLLTETNDENTELTTTVETGLSSVVDSARFGSLHKLILVTVYVYRFVEKLRNRNVSFRNESLKSCEVSSEEYNKSLEAWIREEQRLLMTQHKFNKLKSSLNLFEDDDGILRVKGRFGKSELVYSAKYPIIIRSVSHFAKLVILAAHDRVLHHGIEATLAEVRSKYWLVKGRKMVKTVLRRCVICKRHQAKTVLPPPTPDLPDFRVAHQMNAFSATGLDYAGPLIVRNDNCKDGRKVYILLFTCASSRALHLELVPDMTSQAFIRAFKRFSARRGSPNLIVHDNFRTFRSQEVKLYLLKNGVAQHFILPASPWWGGFYERLVRSVKSTLKKVLGKALLRYEELETLLCEVEGVVNTRPLYYVNEDEIDEVLTPNHLIFGRDISKSNVRKSESETFTAKDFGKRVLHLQTLLSKFWRRFAEIYLNELRQKHMYGKSKTNSNPNLTIGDVVVIKADSHLPRTEWRLGKIEKVIAGQDGHIRGVQLTAMSKNGKRTVVQRPLQKIIPLEVTDNYEETDRGLDIEATGRPKLYRKAAIDGEQVRRLRQRYS